MNATPEKDVIFGTRPVVEALQAGKEVEKILIQKNAMNESIKTILDLARTYHVPVVKVPIEKLNRITRKNHQGVVGYLSAVIYASLDNIVNEKYQSGKSPFLLMLDRITDMRNFGAIARTAECAGVDAIIVPAKGGALINADAMKTSAGALHFIPVCRSENLKETIVYLKNSGIQVIACTEKTDQLIYQQDFVAPVCLLLGSEEDGVSSAYLKLADSSVMVYMSGKIASLNVSVAAAIAMYEVVRQRQYASRQ
jgi:23S rRNA (guanosine2251-2'-O)-methyltransferase